MPEKRYEIGQFVTALHSEHEVAIVVLDQIEEGYSDSYMVRWLIDGHISLRKHDEIKAVDPKTAVGIWCRTILAT